MIIKRTANAGVLLLLDDISILLDGVCNQVPPYLSTPKTIRNELVSNLPDVLAFTHKHNDHFDDAYVDFYKRITVRPVCGPDLPLLEKGNVRLQAIPSRHIGKADIPHVSFIITGSKCIWFMGDASPIAFKNIKNLPNPDVIIAPYAYANTDLAWKTTRSFGAKDIIILHLPDKENDEYKLWDAVESTVKSDTSVHIPAMGETITIV